MHWLTDPFHFAFMWRALAGATIVGVLCAVVGTFVVLRGISLMGDGLAHGSLAGLAAGYLLHWNIYLTAGFWSIGLAMLVGYVTDRTRIKMDTAVGVLFTASMGLGVVLISRGDRPIPDLNSYLFGSILGMGETDLLIILVGAVLVLALVALFFKELLFITFDRDAAVVAGVPTGWMNYLMLVLIAITVVLALMAMGVLLASAFLIIPAATAFQFSRRLTHMMGLAAFFSLVGSVVGLYASYYLSTATGGTIGLTLAALFGLTLAYTRLRVPLSRSLGLRQRAA